MEEERDIYILGIESSCDDTSAAVLRNGVLLSNVTASQDVHKAYGGVVPELASRAHQQNVVPVVDQAIKRAGITKEMLSAVAYTRGPGLMGSLLVGVNFAKGLARSLNIPLLDVNHLQVMSWLISSKKMMMTKVLLLSLSFVCWCQEAIRRLLKLMHIMICKCLDKRLMTQQVRPLINARK